MTKIISLLMGVVALIMMIFTGSSYASLISSSSSTAVDAVDLSRSQSQSLDKMFEQVLDPGARQ